MVKHDPLEQSLFEGTVAEIQSQPFITVPPDVTVRRAIETMHEKQVACLLVVEDDRLLGLFTERDVLNRVAEQYDKTCDMPIRDMMTPNPIVLYDDKPAATALCAMAAGGYRHVPVLDVNEKITGIVSPQRLIGFIREHITDE